MEPFKSPTELKVYKRRLAFPNAKSSCFNKIQVFGDDEWEEIDVSDTIQQLTIEYKVSGESDFFKITIVYSRCSYLERFELWKDLEEISNHTNIPWLVDGDFNVIMNDSRKLGGLPVTQQETLDFS